MKKVAKTGTPRKPPSVRKAIGAGVRERRRLQKIMDEERRQTADARAKISSGVKRAVAEGRKGGRPKGTPQSAETKERIGAAAQARHIQRKINEQP